MDLRSRSALPLAVRLTLIMTSLMVAAVLVVTLLSIQREQESFRSELQLQAQLILDTLVVATGDALFLLDADFLEDTMEELQSSSSGVFGRVYDPSGRVIADASLVNTLVFSTDINPFGQQLATSEGYLFEWQPDRLVAGKAARFGRQLLGAISVELSTQALVLKMEAVRNQGIIIALGTAALGTLAALLVSRTITEPLRILQNATQRIGSDLTYRVPLTGQDEFGLVGQAFNQMSARLYEREQELAKRNEALVNEVKERKRAEEQALEASRLKSEFLSTMSHELRTPLNAIEGFSSIMLSGMGIELDPKAHSMVERIGANSKRLLVLINDFLDLSRIESGRMEVVNKPVSVPKLVEKWKSQVGGLAEQKNLEFVVNVDPQLPTELLSDEDALTKITVNLLSNAFKFTHQGSVTLKLRAHQDQWSIEVGDTGIGIPPHAREYIFEEFRQVDGSSKRQYGGTGLGLAIVQKMARLMGGTVTLASEVGQGSTFTVTLPLRTEAAMA